MPGFLKKFLLNIVLGFVIRQLQKWGSQIKWAIVEADLIARAKQILPGSWLDEEAAAFVHASIAIISKVLIGEVIEKVIHLAAEGKLSEAIQYLKEKIVEAIAVPMAEGVAVHDLDEQVLACMHHAKEDLMAHVLS